MNENFGFEKEIVDDIKEQLDLDLMVMKNSGENSVRNTCDGFHSEKNKPFG